MQKIWYIKIDGQREGPLSVSDLKRDRRLTPDTLVWKEGFKDWQPMREVPELKEVFEDENPPPKLSPQDLLQGKPALPDDELILDFGQEPPYLFWLLAALLAVMYMLQKLYWPR